MNIIRKFGNSDEGVDLVINISDDEIINEISKKSIDERLVFFRKLLETDLGKTFPLNLLKKSI